MRDKTSESFEVREGGPERWSEDLKPDFLIPSFKDVTLGKLLDGLKMAHFQKAVHSMDALEKNWKYSQILCPYADKQGENLG